MKKRKICKTSEVNLAQYHKKRLSMKIFLISFLLLVLSGHLVASEDAKENEYKLIPIGVYSYASLASQSVHSPGVAIALKNDINMFVASYQYSKFMKDPLFNAPSDYHAANFLGDIYHEAWNTLVIFRSESDDPFGGGLRTFQLGTAVGYDFFNEESSALIFGLGLAVGDFGVKLSNGKPLLVIPVPLIRYQKESDFIKIDFSFLTGPNFSMTLGAKSKIRLTNDVRFDRLRDAGDIIFESILWYRFFDSTHEFGDFAGVGIGLKREDATFDLANREEVFSVQYYGGFVTFDISILKISAGYTFGAVERHGDDFTTDLNNGFYTEIQGLYQF
ncbi:MAG: hypothetical protein OEZ13_11390 [Spirochaetia bacterium]|nr:hypothetical protein [Spirochaetia bacterium]